MDPFSLDHIFPRAPSPCIAARQAHALLPLSDMLRRATGNVTRYHVPRSLTLGPSGARWTDRSVSFFFPSLELSKSRCDRAWGAIIPLPVIGGMGT
jgi:hypothetical protein